MPGIKWVVSDLDGTLLGYRDGKHYVLPEAFAKILWATDAGAVFSVATGRAYPDVMGVLGLNPEVKGRTRWVVSCNGSVVYDAKERKVVRVRTMDEAEIAYALKVTDGLRKRGHSPVIGMYLPNGAIDMEPQERDGLRFMDFCAKYHGDFSPFLHKRLEGVPAPGKYVKCVVYFPPWNKGGPHAGLEAGIELDERKAATVSSDFAIEFNPDGVSKGEALAWLAPRLGLSLDETLAVGDSGNDKTMLRAARYSVCPQSSAPAVRECAKRVIDAPASAIVGRAIETHRDLIAG